MLVLCHRFLKLHKLNITATILILNYVEKLQFLIIMQKRHSLFTLRRRCEFCFQVCIYKWTATAETCRFHLALVWSSLTRLWLTLKCNWTSFAVNRCRYNSVFFVVVLFAYFSIQISRSKMQNIVDIITNNDRLL